MAVTESFRSSADDCGLLTAAEAALLTDQYELAMAASYLRRDMDDGAIFELFVRRLPPGREWLLAAGLGPALALVEQLRFGPRELDFVRELGFDKTFCEYLADFEFTGDIDAVPEGTIVFAGEPILRVTAPRVEAQILETILLNQMNFQTLVATKAARLVLAAGHGVAGSGGAIIDFSARRDHGTDAAMKAARAAFVAGCEATSNLAAAMRYGIPSAGTMAHSYVLSFDREEQAFRAFMEDFPDNAVMLVDTYDTLDGVRTAIVAARATATTLLGIRLDSGDLLALSREARRILDDAGMPATQIMASGDLEEHRIAQLVRAGAPIDAWGVGTDLGTSRDSPVVNGIYKLVAHRVDGGWRGVSKRSAGKSTLPGAKQVHRRFAGDTMVADTIGLVDEQLPGQPLLLGVMRGGTRTRSEPLRALRDRAAASLASLPDELRDCWSDRARTAFPVALSPRLREHAG